MRAWRPVLDDARTQVRPTRFSGVKHGDLSLFVAWLRVYVSRRLLVVLVSAGAGSLVSPTVVAAATSSVASVPVGAPVVAPQSSGLSIGSVVDSPPASLTGSQSPVDASQTAFAGLTDSAVVPSLSLALPGLLDRSVWGPPSLPVGASVVGYVGRSAERLRLADGTSAVADSSLPITASNDVTGQSAPVNLSLVSSGSGFRAMNPIVPVLIPASLSDGVQLSGGSVSLTPVDSSGAALTGGGAVASGAAVTYPNTSQDADTVIKPNAAGFDAITVLRAPDSPSTLYFKLGLPAGAVLEASPQLVGEYVVRQSGKTIAVIAPPSATDAAGAAVPVTMTASAETLTLNVSRAQGSFQYPITVDPSVGDTYPFSSGSGWWHPQTQGAINAYWQSGNPNLNFYDLSAQYTAGQWAQWYYQTQGVSQIWGLTTTTSQYPNGGPVADYGAIETSGTTQAFSWLPAGTETTGSWSGQQTRICTAWSGSSCLESGGSNGNIAQVVAWPTATGNLDSAVISAATVYITQSTLPVASISPLNYWTDSQTDPINYTAEDFGIGLYAYGINDPAFSNWTTAVPPLLGGTATGISCVNVQCISGVPLALATTVGNLPTGQNTLQACAQNAIPNNPGCANQTIDVDVTPPSLSLSGSLFSAFQAGSVVGNKPLTLTASVSDGSSSAPQSGPGPVTITVDGTPVSPASITYSNGSSSGVCPPAPAPPTLPTCFSGTATMTFNPEQYGQGTHNVRVIANDQAHGASNTTANQTTQSFAISVNQAAQQKIGPGSVNVSSGEFSTQATDVSLAGFGGGLNVARSYRSRVGASTSGPLGPGWTLSLPAGQAGGDYASLAVNPSPDTGVSMTDAAGQGSAFTAGIGGAFNAPAGSEGLQLSKAGSTYSLADTSGDVTTFSGSGSTMMPTSTTQPGTANVTTVIYESLNGQSVPQYAVSAAPGITPSTCTTSLIAGCRVLSFQYATSTTSRSDCPTATPALGDYVNQLKEIDFAAFDPSTGHVVAPNPVVVARYCYDPSGYLRAQWDPRTDTTVTPSGTVTNAGLQTVYGYNANHLLASIAPAGLQAWSINYGPSPYGTSDTNPGSLASVTRYDPTQPGGATAQWTMAYNVPVSGTGAPYALDSTTVAKWAQADDPVTGTAIFPPDEVPSGSPPADYRRATVYYLDAMDRTVNVAAPGGRISTSEYGTVGNNTQDTVMRALTPANRALALTYGSGSAAQSQLLDSQNSYSSDGTELTAVLSPQHTIQLASGTSTLARQHTQYFYDYGNPLSTPQHLLTEKTVGALTPNETNGDSDVRYTSYLYSGQSNLGWALHEPTATIVDPTTADGTTADPSGLALTTNVKYDAATGSVIDKIQPANPSGGDAHDSETILYSAGANSQPNAGSYNCANDPTLAGLPCVTLPVAQPTDGATTGLPQLPVGQVAQTAYNVWEQPLTATATTGGTSNTGTRTTVDTYDGAGRLLTSHVTASSGTALPAVADSYSASTGRLLQKCNLNSGLTACASGVTPISYTYDALGRIATYGDSQKNVANYSYDIDGRVKTVSDGVPSQSWNVGSQAYSYDTTTGDLTGLTDTSTGDTSAAGTTSFTATYNADGAIATEAMSNGLTANYTYDPSGQATSLAYQKTTGCSSNCTWLADSVIRSIHDQALSDQLAANGTQIVNNTSGVATQLATNTGYAYDTAGRLHTATDTPSAGRQLSSTTIPTAYAGPTGITTGPDSNLWFTEAWTGKIGRITPSGTVSEWATGASGTTPYGIVSFAGSLWFADGGANAIGKITTSGAVTEYPITGYSASWPGGIAAGPSGTLRFTQVGSNRIGTINSSGTITSETATTANPDDITAGANGTDYFTETGPSSNGYIGVITSSGTVTEYPLTSGHTTPNRNNTIVFDPNVGTAGSVYFIDSGSNTIGKFDVATHAISYINAPSDASSLGDLTLASTGNIWLTEHTTSGYLGQLNPSTNTITEYPDSSASTGPGALTQGPDGNIWAEDRNKNAIYSMTAGATTTRSYTLDADTNRTGLQTTITTPACGTSTCVTSQTLSYDAADRLYGTGIATNPFGDITTLPAIDAGGTNLTASYYANGTNNTLTQGATTVTNNVDPTTRINEQITTNSGTTASDISQYYDNTTDSPAWTFDNTNNILYRNINDVTGNLAALYTNTHNSNPTTLVYQLANLQGSSIATASSSSSATTLLSLTPTTEYGVPTTPNPAKYSWLGAKHRQTELPSGIIAMGARVYVPQIGAFLQPDPIIGGGATSYGYTDGDPVNSLDLTGAAPSVRELLAQLASSIASAAASTAAGKYVRQLESSANKFDPTFPFSGGFDLVARLSPFGAGVAGGALVQLALDLTGNSHFSPGQIAFRSITAGGITAVGVVVGAAIGVAVCTGTGFAPIAVGCGFAGGQLGALGGGLLAAPLVGLAGKAASLIGL